MNKNVLVYLDESKLSPRGGPYGVGYYIHKEKLKANCDNIHFLPERKTEKKAGFWEDVKKYFSLFVTGTKSTVDINEYDIVHFHTCRDLFMENRALKHYKGTVLLTSHCPEPPAAETMHRIEHRVPAFLRPFLLRMFEKIDKYAFKRADYIIFPCEEAEEPYAKHWPFFVKYKETHKEKFKYVLTGIQQCQPNREVREVREELGLSDQHFVISFVGRHNFVKGYNDLKELGQRILDRYPNAVFVIAGKQEAIPKLEHERWIEVGYTTDAYSYIHAADVFVLPNKETYFDLVMLEVLSLGKPVVASRTGGNKYFEKLHAEGIALYNNLDEAEEILASLISKAELSVLGKANAELFEKHLKSEVMFETYLKLLEKLEK